MSIPTFSLPSQSVHGLEALSFMLRLCSPQCAAASWIRSPCKTILHCKNSSFFHTCVKSNVSTFIVTRLLKCVMFHCFNNCLVFWNHHPVGQDLLTKQTNSSVQKVTHFQMAFPLVLMRIMLRMAAGLLKREEPQFWNKNYKDLSPYSAPVKKFMQSLSASQVLSKRGWKLYLSISTCRRRP